MSYLGKKFDKSLFVFRRDLRLHDNTALIEALTCSEEVVPCFIFDPRQVEKNSFRSKNAIQFMIESLEDLDNELRKRNTRLYLFYGEAERVIKKLITSESINAVFVNYDCTSFSRMRDKRIEKVIKDSGAGFYSVHDLLLTEVGTIMTGKGTPYLVYSHFAKKAAKSPVNTPRKNTYRNYFNKRITSEKQNLLKTILPKSDYNKDIFLKGGRREAQKILKRISDLTNYDTDRNIPAREATTGLSAHNKFGTISIREVYHAIADSFGSSHTLIRELYWRDFFSHVAFHFPHIFGHCFHEKYEHLEWENDRKKFKAWCNGKTGFPIVDGGMRQLNVSGFMHNRVRMIVASFLVKDLHIDWRWGEKYFAKKLVDYDPAVNNGNWQWAASTGCDAQPYFRIFNPWIQGKKFDPDCIYIKKWVPELGKYSAKDIHRLEKGITLDGYPEAIVDHSDVKQIAEDMFLEASDKASNS